ncbi:MAG TPA: efflux transporter outer membrane subunit [Candidatus Polarisedimenticolaceae bacterium]|nr:efflux transporter outer membrane subunit [Candidatus Polarisedimenticolaceae bacterium]
MRTERARKLVLLGAMLILSGCLKPFQYKKPEVELNPQWTQQDASKLTSGEADAAWWHAFGDPTLDRLIETARRQNLPLQAAGLRIYEARAQLALSVGRQYPQIQAAFASATAVGLSEHAANSAFADRQYGDYQVGFDAVWELDFWGRYRSDVRAQTAQHLATLADYDAALVSLTAEVARNYAVVRTFEALIAQSRTNVTLQEEGLRIAGARYRYGATSELDVHQATTLLESTRATIPQLEIGLAQARNALATLLGQSPGSLDALLAAAAGIPAAPAAVAVSMPAELLRRRPDVRRQELLSMAQGERIGVARADLYPRFSLFGEIGLQTSTGAGTLSNDAKLGDLFKGGSLFWAFGPRISWPIWNYGRIKNNIRIQDARFQQQLVDYQNTVLEAQREVEDGLVGYLKSQEATLFAQNAAEAAQRSADLAMVQYREGAVDYQRVLDAQRSLLQEQITLTQNTSSIATNLIALYKALGGGWELHDQPMVPDLIREEMEQRTDWGDLLTEPPPAER